MPRANVGDIKRWLQDHDTDEVSEAPPVQNTWYEVFHAEDVRLIWCEIYQENDEVVAKIVQTRWTIDGNIYFDSHSIPSGTTYFIYRNREPSTGGTLGLSTVTAEYTAARFDHKRGLDFKVEVRTTEAPGTNQILRCRCVRETEEIT